MPILGHSSRREAFNLYNRRVQAINPNSSLPCSRSRLGSILSYLRHCSRSRQESMGSLGLALVNRLHLCRRCRRCLNSNQLLHRYCLKRPALPLQCDLELHRTSWYLRRRDVQTLRQLVSRVLLSTIYAIADSCIQRPRTHLASSI